MGLETTFYEPVQARNTPRGVPYWTAALIASAAFSAGALITMPGTGDGPTIGGETVPAHLDCHENDVIAYDADSRGSTAVIACVHVDRFPTLKGSNP